MTDLEEIPDRPDHAHCWHLSPLVLASNPERYQEICCHCGQTQVVRYEVGEGHGRFYPVPFRPFGFWSMGVTATTNNAEVSNHGNED